MARGKLTERIKRTAGIESFRFLPEEKIQFTAGQFLQIIFDETNVSNQELNKYLSFSSSPTKDYIEVTKRLSASQFSQRLKNLEEGDEILFKAPLGSCVFKDEYKKIGFLIGGIGITPVISIIEYIMDKKLDTDVTLLYSNKTEEDIAFRKELDLWASANSNIKVFYTVTECEPKDKRCIFGQINKDLLTEKFKALDERIFFIFGPPKMVEAMKNLCLEAGFNKENVKTENFIGY
ncbi:MAG: FAD-dependent oxidoreductase [Candidatus Omnitrophica bacterium]|nr:FAD-dependent oxidoreductase [Candidatus Omnitrophota bacterium]MDD5352959.1 FAD-dependent oxidoreductase [Candidatus Omnitrophota bacterium]MDD5550558.1 FAD-dependent oxidoreductase [Candidatus Omnitrophota bacterium]